MGISKETLRFGILPTGKRDCITDVPGVTVGHFTRAEGEIQTGVTAILPHGGDIFHEKLAAAVHVINGFGKSAGLIQVQELGTLESPVILTNTFAVGTAYSAVVRYLLARNPDIGLSTGTVNPVILECNDAELNDIRGMHLTEEDVLKAIDAAGSDFEEGGVGGGRGMCCYDLKGGIGTASRMVELDGGFYTVGALLMTNFGSMSDLTVCGKKIGTQLKQKTGGPEQPDKGSVIIVLATDLPMSARQLKRGACRAQNGLARTGGITGTGSGEIVLFFSTANRFPHDPSGSEILRTEQIHEERMDLVFRAVAECVEESVISSLLHAETVTGRGGNVRWALSELLPEYKL